MTIRKLISAVIITAVFPLIAFSQKDKKGTVKDTREYVDLGLPSKTLWATCNIGASKPEEFGLYFAWGDTQGYTSDASDEHQFIEENYKWLETDCTNPVLMKYCISWSGIIDNKKELDPEDDAAIINWGSNWRMPTEAQMIELYEYTTSQSTLLNGVKGEMLTSRINGLHIFFPAAGYISGETFYYKGSRICFWLCEISHWDIGKALTYGGKDPSSECRECGLGIRPVRVKN